MFPSDREYKTRGIAPIKETRPVEVVKTKLAGNNLGRYENSGRKQKRLKKASAGGRLLLLLLFLFLLDGVSVDYSSGLTLFPSERLLRKRIELELSSIFAAYRLLVA